jgi:hypothetical protein
MESNEVKYKGVSFKPHQGKYVASLCVDYKSINVGSFDTADEAVRARDRLIMKMNLPYSKLQKLMPLNKKS